MVDLTGLIKQKAKHVWTSYGLPVVQGVGTSSCNPRSFLGLKVRALLGCKSFTETSPLMRPTDMSIKRRSDSFPKPHLASANKGNQLV